MGESVVPISNPTVPDPDNIFAPLEPSRNESYLELESKLRSLQDTALHREKARRYQLAWERYTKAAKKINVPADPVTSMSFMEYIVQYVGDQGGSTRSVDNVKSHLRCVCKLMKVEWLSEYDNALVNDYVKDMKLKDVSMGLWREPLLRDILVRVVEVMDLSDREQLLDAVMYMLCHDSLMRSGELLRGLVVRDLRWSSDFSSVTIVLFRTKTHRSGGPIEIVLRRGTCPFCAVDLLKRWMDVNRLWGCWDHQVFPAVVEQDGRIGLDFGIVHQKSRWIARLRSRLDALGYIGAHFGGHSFRAGGASDLFNSGVDLVIIMKYGRWATAASAMVYYRTCDQVAEVVCRAIGGRVHGGHGQQWPLLGIHCGHI